VLTSELACAASPALSLRVEVATLGHLLQRRLLTHERRQGVVAFRVDGIHLSLGQDFA
jgi:hypothetical protein